ncbi:MAG TPA: hypothetical protein VK674_04755 [Candidatus Limnocylindria bacterium]|nr:hypothetical protein [Candidatus Limnocylindria bacterium]
MGKYVYVYYAGTASDGGSAEEWGKWFGELGDKLIDGGNPFAEGGKAVNKEGVMDVQDPPVTGYSIVKADSMEGAVELSKGCPLLSSKDGAVCVYEALPM